MKWSFPSGPSDPVRPRQIPSDGTPIGSRRIVLCRPPCRNLETYTTHTHRKCLNAHMKFNVLDQHERRQLAGVKSQSNTKAGRLVAVSRGSGFLQAEKNPPQARLVAKSAQIRDVCTDAKSKYRPFFAPLSILCVQRMGASDTPFFASGGDTSAFSAVRTLQTIEVSARLVALS